MRIVGLPLTAATGAISGNTADAVHARIQPCSVLAGALANCLSSDADGILANDRTALRIRIREARRLTFLKSNGVEKIPWSGVLISIQAQIRLGRLFDQRAHMYLGYGLTARGNIGNKTREFPVGVGGGAHAKHQFRARNTVASEALPVADPRLETAEFYKVSDLKVTKCKVEEEKPSPLWLGVPPPLRIYRERGHRQLAARTFEEKCTRCI